MKPNKFTTWLCFDYKGVEDVEVKVEYDFSGNPEEGFELDLEIIKNESKFDNGELLEFIYNNDKICDKLYEDQSYQVQEYIDGYNERSY